MSKYAPIVWVEDDTDDQQLIKVMVKQLAPARELIMLDSGEALIDYLQNASEQPFIVLSDINMPGMNGFELRTQLVNDPKLFRKAIPFIFFSTSAEEPEVKKAYDMVVQGFFEKGVDYETLKAKLKKIIDYWEECKHPNAFK